MTLLPLEKPRTVDNMKIVLSLNFKNYVPLWLIDKLQIVNDKNKWYTTKNYMKRWDKLDSKH